MPTQLGITHIAMISMIRSLAGWSGSSGPPGGWNLLPSVALPNYGRKADLDDLEHQTELETGFPKT